MENMSATLKNSENNNDCGLKVRNFWPCDDTSVFQTTTGLNNNEAFPKIEYISKDSKVFANDLDKEAKTQFWTRQSFINMYIQSKYLEILAKNQPYVGCNTTELNDSESKPLFPPQDIPLDLSIKSINSDTSSEDAWNEHHYKENVSSRNDDNKNIINTNLLPRNFNNDSPTEQQELILNHNFINNLTLPTIAAYTCLVCGQSFNLQDRLAKHIASCHKQKKKPSDTGKSYECEICKRSFARSDMLTRHSRLHSGLKPYTCNVCRQVFSRSDHLSTHQRTHTGEKPYKCPYSLCQYAACRRDMINRHLRTHLRQDSKLIDIKETQNKIKTPDDLIIKEIKSEL